ncbi:hypothetical protein N9L68_05420 [bacterium]|nr:hypothetical protein [bacterium]
MRFWFASCPQSGRAAQSRTEQSRAEQSGAERNGAGRDRAKPSGVEQSGRSQRGNSAADHSCRPRGTTTGDHATPPEKWRRQQKGSCGILIIAYSSSCSGETS